MRRITYAGETVITTDDVAAVLVDLTAAIASAGRADAVAIPIMLEGSDDVGEAELVIGVGNDVLSRPVRWEGEEPDFSSAAAGLREHSLYPVGTEVGAGVTFVDDPDMYWDPDLDGFEQR